MTKDEVLRLRERIAHTPVNGRGRQYTEELRQAIASYAERQQADGKSYKQIANALGLSSVTLLNWRDKTPLRAASTRRPVGFRPVALREQEPRKCEACDEPDAEEAAAKSNTEVAETVAQPVVVLPGGVRIEGMTVRDLVELVRRMGCLR